MGKWATYQKRGSHHSPPALPAPPIPTLEEEDGSFVSYTLTAVNVGGTLTLQYESPVGHWITLLTTPFANPNVLWGDITDFAPESYRAFQTGNGTSFAGNSEPSPTVVIS